MGISAGSLAKFTSRFDLSDENGEDEASDNENGGEDVGLGTKLFGELPDEDGDAVADVREVRERGQ